MKRKKSASCHMASAEKLLRRTLIAEKYRVTHRGYPAHTGWDRIKHSERCIVASLIAEMTSLWPERAFDLQVQQLERSWA